MQLYLPGFFDPDMLRIDRHWRNSSLFASIFGGSQLSSQGTSKVVHRVFPPVSLPGTNSRFGRKTMQTLCMT